jgi:subtilase family serine protease
LAPGATIDYYQSTVGSNGYASQTGLEDALNLAGTDANNNGQITNSWDYCSSSTDPFETTTESILASNAATGHDYLFASGDNGSACHDVTTGFYQDPYPFFPASSPYVTSVGATEFSSTVNGGYPGEVAHSYSGCSPLCGLIYPSGSGGGYSNAFPRASWQIDPNANRAFPDVAADGDPNTPACVVYGSNTSCTSIAGTSLSSPLWAGMLAVVNSYLLGNGEPATGFADAALYSMATATQPYPAYHDITSGTNGQYSCAPGWDPVTGLGSPDLYNLARDLAGATPGPTATPTNTPTPTTTPLPTATATLVPSATATSTPTNTATIGPTSTSTPIPPLGAPQSLAAAPASGKKGAGIALTWKAPASNGGSAITGYRIYRGTSSGAETLLTTVGVQLSYTDRSTSSGRRYFYKVSALNPNEGPLSNEASATAR